MQTLSLTRKQKEVLNYLMDNYNDFDHPPTFESICHALGLKSRGSMHKHIKALVDDGWIEPVNNQKRGVRLTTAALRYNKSGLPMMGYIAAGKPIEAVSQPDYIDVPEALKSSANNYVLQVKGESMIDEGILDGDWVVIEHKEQANNGEIIVALVDDSEVTLKRIEQKRGKVILHPANPIFKPTTYKAEQVKIQGVLVGLMRHY